MEDRVEVSSKRRGEPDLRDGWAIQVGRRQPRAGAAGRPGLTAAKCRTRPCHEGRDGGLWANSEAASVSNGKGGGGGGRKEGKAVSCSTETRFCHFGK